ncbi:MAG: lipoprotein [Ramlibacter sp.]|nr:lipoprotein [Ramlibacter sp.]
MLRISQILVSALLPSLVLAAGVVALAGCGQRGPLYLPTGDAATARATLPQTLAPSVPGAPASAPR